MPKREPAVRREPVWWADAEPAEFHSLSRNETVDVGIVGAGIAGLTIAYRLAREGRSVAVVDDGPLGDGMTGATSGHLTVALDRRYGEIARVRGEAGARLAAASHAAAIDEIESIAEREEIRCGFERVDGWLFESAGDDPRELDLEADAARAAGVPGVALEAAAPLPSATGRALRFPRQALFHPLRYLSGLARAAARHGARIHTETHADSVEGGDAAEIRCGEFVLSCGAIVVATNSPINDRFVLHLKQAPYMTYVIGLGMPRDLVPDGLYWDLADPFHYVRTHRTSDGDFLIVGGEDHKSGQSDETASRHERLEGWARERFPGVGPLRFTWAGQVMETIDGLAFLGRNPMDADNVYVVTGDSGNGLTHGTIAGILIADLVAGRSNPWTELYDPSRKPVLAARRFAREAINAAAQYVDRALPGEAASPAEIPRDSGAVVRRGGKQVAVYRGPRGALHETSAVCPHLGCVVQWNGAERTWDCPCHGSRFDRFGKVVNGPANAPLPRVKD